ncbi:MAG: pantoate--beta-alanine ligase [Anaerolineales bacterium]|nr:pantoate--beta-alanine ligase [Anaerolineales bacterium]
MKTIYTYPELLVELSEIKRPMGFVPTMGFLHEGHLSLIRKAKQENSSVVVSIFTNPTQFAPEEDLENYPTDIDRDLELLMTEGVDLVWIPAVTAMYPESFQTWVSVDQMTKFLEGVYRPSHFRGVTTIVSKLFNAVRPERAYFGQKDAQQARVIQQMVVDLYYPIEIVVCPIIREEDGLAMSSRNSYLSVQEREAALCLSRALKAAQETFSAGERNAEVLREIVSREIIIEEAAKIQYISCAHPNTLEELNGEIQACLISLAVFVGNTRLIDNIILPEPY